MVTKLMVTKPMLWPTTPSLQARRAMLDDMPYVHS